MACCSAVLDSPTNGTCSCVLLPQLLGTLDKETMLPCTDRGSAHNQTNVPLVLSVAQCSARNSAVVSATAGWLNQWARAGVGSAEQQCFRAVISKLRHEEGLAHPLAGQRQWCGPCRAPCASTCDISAAPTQVCSRRAAVAATTATRQAQLVSPRCAFCGSFLSFPLNSQRQAQGCSGQQTCSTRPGAAQRWPCSGRQGT